MPEPTPVRFGILGCGTASIAVCEAMSVSPFAEIGAVYDVNQTLANDLSQRFHIPAMENLQALLSSDVDVVYVAVPHHLLANLTRQVLEAGKHALTEKPLGVSLQEVDELIQLSEEKQLALGVLYEMRYALAHAKAREFIEAGAIGKIVGVQIQTLIDKRHSYWQSGYAGRSISPWRSIKAQSGGGVVLMNSSHLLDVLFYVTSLRVTRVFAEIGNLIANVEVEDTAAATLRFDNGAMGSLIAGAHISGAQDDEHITIYGTEGQIRLPDPYGSNAMQFYVKRTWRDFTGRHWHSIPMESVPVHQRAIDEYVKAIRSGDCVPIDAQAARRVLAIVLAIYQSSAEQRPISIS
jgi:predicted dehydrogenase